MRRTTPAELLGDIQCIDYHRRSLNRPPVISEDETYHDGIGNVERWSYDLLDDKRERAFTMTFDIQCAPEDHDDYTWITPPPDMSWIWWDEQHDRDVEFERVSIRSDLELSQYQVHVISRSQIILSITYRYESALEVIQ